MHSVYIETTIPSFYHTLRRSPQAIAWHEQTKRWWDMHRHRYTLFTSAAVIQELADAPPERSAPRLAMLDGVPQLVIGPEVGRVVAEYLSHRLMPRDGGLDAVHAAVASFYGLDFLLTWNCLHLANANKARHLAAINTRLGLHVPMIITPYNLE